MICKKYSFQKRTQFSQGNNVPDATASNTHQFLSRDICLSSTYLNNLFGAKRAYQHIETLKLQEIFHSKTDTILTGKQCATCSFFLHRRFSLRDSFVSSI
jgi:hypothetical protein